MLKVDWVPALSSIISDDGLSYPPLVGLYIHSSIVINPKAGDSVESLAFFKPYRGDDC